MSKQICKRISLFSLHLVYQLPRAYPSPKNISFQAIIVETLLGNIFINMETLEAQVAAKAVPSKNLHKNDRTFPGLTTAQMGV